MAAAIAAVAVSSRPIPKPRRMESRLRPFSGYPDYLLRARVESDVGMAGGHTGKGAADTYRVCPPLRLHMYSRVARDQLTCRSRHGPSRARGSRTAHRPKVSCCTAIRGASHGPSPSESESRMD